MTNMETVMNKILREGEESYMDKYFETVEVKCEDCGLVTKFVGKERPAVSKCFHCGVIV